MLQIKNTLGGGKPEGLYVWKKNEISKSDYYQKKVKIRASLDFSYGSAVEMNGVLYILGGSDTSDTSYNDSRTFRTWDGETFKSYYNTSDSQYLPYDFYDGSSVVLNGEIHILGGSGNNTAHYKWDGSSWTSVSTLPYAFYRGQATVYNNEIHILGGWGSGTNDANNNHYKWNGTEWVKVGTTPYYCRNGYAVTLDDGIHLIGGYNCSYHYVWNGSSWVSKTSYPYTCYSGGCVVLNGYFHILGGTGTQSYHYYWSGSEWALVTDSMSYGMYNGAAGTLNDEIYLIGGTSYSNNFYLEYGWDAVHTFVNYVVSDKETAYPDGGEKDGYYYEKVSDVKVASGTISLSTSITTTTKSINIEHGLGKTPTKFAIMPISTEFNSSKTLCAMGIDDTIIREYYNIDSYYGYFQSINKSILTMNETNITIPCYISGYTTYGWIDGTYHWIAIAE